MNLQSRCLIFDPFAGISGDMVLGALVDLGLGAEWLHDLVTDLPVRADVKVRSVRRGALAATAVNVVASGPEPERHLVDVLEIIDAARVDNGVKDTARAAFQRLAEAEAAVHGIEVDKVHFHEVGASDAIIDILGAAHGIAQLDVQRCLTRPIAIGRGWTSSAHGALPLPAPATLKLLEGLPVLETDIDAELTTPTGAAILATLTGGERLTSDFQPLRSAYGAGSRDPDSHPNCLRVVLAEIASPGDLWMLQADIDDMSPEYLPPLVQALFDAGAVDVTTLPVQMKKGRTGIRVEALVRLDLREAVGNALLEGSTTLGLRFWPVQRQTLPRSEKRIEWRGLSIRLKTARTPAGHVRCKLEYDDVIEAARALNLPAWKVRQELEALLQNDT
jgi:uncharacterized protein (TIGR00299 family) protein